jgi:predicted DNA-binding transcriptional regulator YafY
MVLDKQFDGGHYQTPKIDPAEDTSAPCLVNVRLLISPLAKYRIYDEFAESDITVNKDGSFTVCMNQGQWIYDYILSYGSAVEVLEPQHIRDGILVRIDTIKNKYSSKT